MTTISQVVFIITLIVANHTTSAQNPAFVSTKKDTDKKQLKLGAQLYNKYQCNACHASSGKGMGDLTKAYEKYTTVQLQRYIKNPREFNNTTMPVYRDVISETDLPPLIAFIKQLGRNK